MTAIVQALLIYLTELLYLTVFQILKETVKNCGKAILTLETKVTYLAFLTLELGILFVACQEQRGTP